VRKDDFSLSPEELERVRAEARLALERANAFGRLPTPVADILSAAKLTVVDDEALEEGLLARFRRKASGALKTALSKVLGLFDARGWLIHVDRGLMAVKQTFIKLHEAGHGLLIWQRKMYAVAEDCKLTLTDEIEDLFEREANNFATEVLFQLDGFTEQTADYAFGINVPLKLGPKFGASAYSSIRRYVRKNERACVVLVLDPPVVTDGVGFRATLRRVVPSPAFVQTVGDPVWPAVFTPDDELGDMVPLGKRRMSRPRTLSLSDRNGIDHECLAEAFATPYQVFILIHLRKPLTKTTIILPSVVNRQTAYS
jgi:hypothetical protein